MTLKRFLIPLSIVIGTIAGAALWVLDFKPYSLPRDSSDPNAPYVYINGASRRKNLKITANGELVRNGELMDELHRPLINLVGVPRGCYSKCVIRVRWGLFKRAEKPVDWSAGNAVIVDLNGDMPTIEQAQAPIDWYR